MTIPVIQTPIDKRQLAETLRAIIDEFPGALPKSLSGFQDADPAVGEAIQRRLRAWDLQDGKNNDIFKNKFISAHHVAVTAYEHIPSIDLQAEIALYTGLLFIIDDALIDSHAVAEFVPRLCSGSRQLHPVLDRVAETCHSLQKFYPAFGANSIYASTIDFVSSDHFQSQDKVRNLPLGRDSVPYVKFMREKDSIGAAYAAFIWPKDSFPNSVEYIQVFPDTIACIGFINDIFSYYKEAKAEEKGTYIAKLAVANERSEIEELEHLIVHVISLVQRVRRVLKAGKARDTWESVMGGFIRFHFQAPRYELQEIFSELFA